MLTAACTNLCKASADLGSEAATRSTEVMEDIEPGCGGGRSRTMVTASKAVCFQSGPAPTRHVYIWNNKIPHFSMIRNQAITENQQNKRRQNHVHSS